MPERSTHDRRKQRTSRDEPPGVETTTRARAGQRTLAIAGTVVLLSVVLGAVFLGGLSGDSSPAGPGNATPTVTPTDGDGSPTATATAGETNGSTPTDTARTPKTEPAGGDEPNETTSTKTDPSTETATQSPGTPTTVPTATPAGSPEFAFEVRNVESCGGTCREVTAGLTNEGSVPANNVTVEVNVLVGDDRIWRDTERVGALGPGETYESSDRIEIGALEALKIQQNGGYVTIETVVTHDGETQQFTRREKVL